MLDERAKQLRLADERWSKRLIRKEKKQEARRKFKGEDDEAFGGVYRSKVLDLFHDFQPHKLRQNMGPKTFIVPADFSFVRNVVDVLHTIREIIRFSRAAKKPRLILDHRGVKDIGLGAEALLALILKEINRENSHVKGAYIRGYKPLDSSIRRMMDEVGCARLLGHGADDIRVSITSNSLVFRHHNRGKVLSVDSSTIDPISMVTKEFSDHLDECLLLNGRRLTERGRLAFAQHMGEVLINAQEHSGTANWVVVGYIDGDDVDTRYRAAIISMGNTISDTFRKLPSDSFTMQLIRPYLDKHEKSGFFSPSWTVDSLLSVVALQGNISSKLDGPENDRGQGTVDLIGFFQDMSKECAGEKKSSVMCILSGNSIIKFDGKYRMKYEDDVRRKVIAFNSRNSLMDPPDSAAVRTFSGKGFPGVIVSMAVPLSEGVVEEVNLE